MKVSSANEKKKDINFNEKLYLNIKMCGRKRTDTL